MQGERVTNSINSASVRPQMRQGKKDPSGNHPISCKSITEGPCCAEWEVDMDFWWQNHPDWEWSSMDAYHQCFTPFRDPRKAEYIQKVHSVQWNMNCSLVRAAHQISSGFSASIGTQVKSFYSAFTAGLPYSPSKHWVGARWIYSWFGNYTVCNTTDLQCYFLPITNCKPRIGQHDAVEHRDSPSFDQDMLKWYLTRPKQWLRHRIYRYMVANFNSTILPTPCTVFHVRRADITREKSVRTYVRVQEYLRASNLTGGENILLLTDSSAAIEEAEILHPNYNWMYIKRKRFSANEGGWESHIPSGDPVNEVVAILTELTLAEQCDQLVHTLSSFSNEILSSMTRHGKQVKKVKVSFPEINGSLPYKPAEKKKIADAFMESLNADIQKARISLNITKTY